MDNFQLYHQNKLNIITHIATTTSAFISVFSMFDLTKACIMWLLFNVGLLFNNVSFHIKLKSFTVYLFYLLFSRLFYDNETYEKIIVFGVSYILQELSHIVTNEQTYQSSYMSSTNIFNFNTWIIFLDHTLNLVPYLLHCCTNKENLFDVMTQKRNRLCLGKLKNTDSRIIKEWVMKNKELSLDTTTHWWYLNLPSEQKTIFLNISNQLKDIIIKNFGNEYDIDVIHDMNEVYVSSITTKISSDTVFETPHLDGPFGFIPFFYCYRSIIAVSENGYIDTLFTNHGKDNEDIITTLETDMYASFDYNREMHYIKKKIVNDDYNQNFNRRIVLKIHYCIYPKTLKFFGMIFKWINSYYNTIARRLFLFTLKPSTNTQHAVTVSILKSTNIWVEIERYIGFNNITYLAFMKTISYFTNCPWLFIYSTSYVHYLIYISTFYYRANIHFNSFVRNCLVYKTVSLINLLFIFNYPVGINHALAACGYMITILSTYALGKHYTYFGIELGLVEYKKINKFPYGVIPHPMITGQLFALISIILLVSPFSNEFFILLMHIILYIVHMLQEIYDIHKKK
jgi:hypothetical protein